MKNLHFSTYEYSYAVNTLHCKNKTPVATYMKENYAGPRSTFTQPSPQQRHSCVNVTHTHALSNRSRTPQYTAAAQHTRSTHHLKTGNDDTNSIEGEEVVSRNECPVPYCAAQTLSLVQLLKARRAANIEKLILCTVPSTAKFCSKLHQPDKIGIILSYTDILEYSAVQNAVKKR